MSPGAGDSPSFCANSGSWRNSVERGRANDVPPLHRLLVCVQASLRPPRGLADLEAGCRPRRLGASDLVGVEARAGADAARRRPAVAEMDGDAVLGLARLDPHRRLDAAAVDRELDDHLGLERPADSPCAGLDHRDVVPGELGLRLGQLLEPAVVRPSGHRRSSGPGGTRARGHALRAAAFGRRRDPIGPQRVTVLAPAARPFDDAVVERSVARSARVEALSLSVA